MAPHSSTLAWKIPWTEKPSRLQSMGSLESDTTERLHFYFSLSCIGEGMATHSSVLAWRIPGMGKPGGLLSMGSHRVGHDWSDLAAAVSDTVNTQVLAVAFIFIIALILVFMSSFQSEIYKHISASKTWKGLVLRSSEEGRKKYGLGWISACNAEDTGGAGSIPRSGRSPRRGHGNPLQYSCWENPMDREAWWATVHRIAAWLRWLSLHGTASIAWGHRAEVGGERRRSRGDGGRCSTFQTFPLGLKFLWRCFS